MDFSDILYQLANYNLYPVIKLSNGLYAVPTRITPHESGNSTDGLTFYFGTTSSSGVKTCVIAGTWSSTYWYDDYGRWQATDVW